MINSFLENRLRISAIYNIIIFESSSIKDVNHQGMKDKNVSCRQVWILDIYDSYSSVFELIAICVILLCQLWRLRSFFCILFFAFLQNIEYEWKNVMSFVDVVWLGKNKGHMDEARKPYLWSLISGISRRSCYHGSRSHIVVMYVIIILHEKFIPVLKMTNRLWLQICSINITRLITIPVLLKIIIVVGM